MTGPDPAPSSDAVPHPPFTWAGDGLVLLVALTLPTLGTWLYFDVFAGQGRLPAALYSGTKLAQLLLPIAWMVLARRQKLRWPRWHRQSLIVGFAFGLLSVGVILGAYYLLSRHTTILAGTPEKLQAKLADFGVTGVGGFIALALFLSILHAAFEEYYWRWFVFGRLAVGLPVAAALLISSVGFAAHHVLVVKAYLPHEQFWTLAMGCGAAIAVGGAFWAWLYRWTGHIAGAWIAHVLADLAIMAVGFDLVKGNLT